MRLALNYKLARPTALIDIIILKLLSKLHMHKKWHAYSAKRTTSRDVVCWHNSFASKRHINSSWIPHALSTYERRLSYKRRLLAEKLLFVGTYVLCATLDPLGTMRNRSETDPRMIRPHTRPSRTRRTAEVDHRGSGTDFVWKNIGFRASAISQKCISCETSFKTPSATPPPAPLAIPFTVRERS